MLVSKICKVFCIFSSVSLFACSNVNHVVNEPVESKFSTEKTVTVDGRELTYTASWDAIPLKLQAKNLATISGTTYSITTGSKRPTIFFFNGGPGASSSPLHFGSFGPKLRQKDAQGQTVFVDNNDTLLTNSDLVFIDPVGTGFSRNLDTENFPFFTSESDAQSIVTFIEYWLQKYKNKQTDIYLVGESYGGFRLALMMPLLKQYNVKGVLLVSPMLDATLMSEHSGNDLQYIQRLPSMAVTSWYHGLSNSQENTAEAVFNKALNFAQTKYTVALQRGSEISTKEFTDMASEISNLLGLDMNYVLQKNLRIPVQDYLENLIPNKTIGRLDSRVARENAKVVDNKDRPKAANDPSLGLGQSNKIISGAIKEYFVSELGFNINSDYYSLNLDANFSWDWRGESKSPTFYVNPTNNLAVSGAKDLNVIYMGGYFDLATPVYSVTYALNHSELSKQQLSTVYFDAGHSPFSNEKDRKRASQLVKQKFFNQ